MQLSRGNRTGRNFTVRISEAQLDAVRAAGYGTAGPAALGPWLLWSAVERSTRHCPHVGCVEAAEDARGGSANPDRPPGEEISARGQCRAQVLALPDLGRPVILDLCGGSGAWSQPYRRAGYDVRIVEAADDVRTWQPPAVPVRGILAAPPCQHFSIARTTGGARDLQGALEIVLGCLRIVALARPSWWALENPGSGLLRRWLGRPRYSFQPYHHGDTHSKLTALWGVFALPPRRPARQKTRMIGHNAAARAVTPAGFAEDFFRANP